MDRTTLAQLCREHHAFVAADNDFQRRARLLQSLWREHHGLPIGEHRGAPLGSRLAMPFAEESLANYLTETVRAVARAEVLDPERSRGKLFGRPRIFNDLLSSQPLCFNLFGELQADLDLASRALGRVTSGRIERVTAIHFEHSPGRGDVTYTGDRSAFDVFIEYATPSGARGFAGIEVKYHEDLADRPSPHRARYDEIARASGAFVPETLPQLRQKPLQQIWRDHLLALSLLQDPRAGYAEGFFVFLHPQGNDRCASAAADYARHLARDGTFLPLTLEALATAIQVDARHSWIDAFVERYLALP